MTDDLAPTESELEAVESKTDKQKKPESGMGDLQGRLAAYSNTLRMEAVLESLTDDRATSTPGKDKTVKALKKAKRNMESTENSVQEKSEELLGEIELARADSKPDSESVGMIKARVKRAVEEIRDSQKELKKGKLNLVDLISDQEQMRS